MSMGGPTANPRLTGARPSWRSRRPLPAIADRTGSRVDSRTAVPWGAVGAIAMILAVECFVSHQWLDLTDPVSLSWRFSAGMVRAESTRCELLCLGDSLIKHGLIPRVIEEETGRRTTNLSAARAPALLTYFLLRRALEMGAQPEAIIINAKPAVLLADPEFNGRYWQEVLTARECLDLAGMTSRAFILRTIVGRLLPSLRARLEVRSNARAVLQGEAAAIPVINRVLWRNWTVNGGGNVASVRAGMVEESETEIEHRLHPELFYVDRTNAAGLHGLMRLASDRNIPVFWLLPPISPDLQERRDRSGAEVGYEHFIQSFMDKYPRILTVLDARGRNYPLSLFADRTHLNGRGAVALSRAVSTAIVPILALTAHPQPPLWLPLRLDLDRPLTSGDDFEDIDQSRRIVESGRR